MSDKHHRYYKHTKFCQNPRGDPKFLVDWTWNDRCKLCFVGIHEATYIKPTGPISGHLMQAVSQLLGYPQHLQEQTNSL